VNDAMGKFVADAAIKKMIEVGQAPRKSKVVILGLTFKENCPDTRNSKVSDIILRLREYGITPVVVDPWASGRDAMHEYGVSLTELEDVRDAECVIVAVAHNEFKTMKLDYLKKLYKNSSDEEKVLVDVKGLYSIEDLNASGMSWWRL
jgi:UDP-N-acetyl-D-galactosamine dehydrogenase